MDDQQLTALEHLQIDVAALEMRAEEHEANLKRVEKEYAPLFQYYYDLRRLVLGFLDDERTEKIKASISRKYT